MQQLCNLIFEITVADENDKTRKLSIISLPSMPSIQKNYKIL
jgi:hypothetical protein